MENCKVQQETGSPSMKMSVQVLIAFQTLRGGGGVGVRRREGNNSALYLILVMLVG